MAFVCFIFFSIFLFLVTSVRLSLPRQLLCPC